MLCNINHNRHNRTQYKSTIDIKVLYCAFYCALLCLLWCFFRTHVKDEFPAGNEVGMVNEHLVKWFPVKGH